MNKLARVFHSGTEGNSERTVQFVSNFHNMVRVDCKGHSTYYFLVPNFVSLESLNKPLSQTYVKQQCYVLQGHMSVCAAHRRRSKAAYTDLTPRSN